MRDKFLTEAMGECWHEFHEKISKGCVCKICRLDLKCLNLQHTNFSTWEGFGKLWNWAQEQEWWYDFHRQGTGICVVMPDLIHPDRFADAVYKYLKERQEGI